MEVIPLSQALTAIHFRSGGTACVAVSIDSHLPVVVYWGQDLGPLEPASIAALIQATRQHVVGNPGDALMEVSVCPEQSRGWLGTPGLLGSRQGTGFSPSFVVTSITVDQGEPAWPDRCRIEAADDALQLGLTVEIEQSSAGLLRQRASLTNHGCVYQVESMSLFFPVPARADRLMDFTGYWSKDRIPQSTSFAYGKHERESRYGRTGFDAAYVLMAGTTFANRASEIWGTHVGWSGNHREIAERTVNAMSLIGGGELLEPGEVILESGETYTTPWVYGVFSNHGLDGIAQQFHATLRARPNHPTRPRPVSLNEWQAVYFDQGLDQLTDLVHAAAEVGVERFVLDDGWFSGRRDDTSSLGDWWVSPEVWPQGLTPLIDLVTSLGMEFGLWFEPEMISPNSELAKAHPEWIASVPQRFALTHRHQQVLNLTIPQAYDHILTSVDKILDENAISYVKWDHNRDLIEAADRTTGRPITHEQTLAAYRLMDELKARHPGLEIESCSSGGARIDLGVIDHVDRFWVSDDIDAVERQSINRWTNLLIPFEMMGTHVEADVSHTTGRHLPLEFRAIQALFGHFGIEWGIDSAGSEERLELAQWISLYKDVRHLIATGASVNADLVRDTARLYGVVSTDRRDALFAWVSVTTDSDVRPAPVQLPGLDPTLMYRITVQAPSVASAPATWGGPVAWLEPDGMIVPGNVLTAAGLAMPVLFPARAILFRVTAL